MTRQFSCSVGIFSFTRKRIENYYFYSNENNLLIKCLLDITINNKDIVKVNTYTQAIKYLNLTIQNLKQFIKSA